MFAMDIKSTIMSIQENLTVSVSVTLSLQKNKILFFFHSLIRKEFIYHIDIFQNVNSSTQTRISEFLKK